ncbi:hypothetical protein PHAVU_003G186900 [Phaseolus vulgaris]|uniref:Calmodulin-binding domain-containing protein n=2 Tax=Phaseolus vulgaris TaxID=3885 RepID=V7CDA7_PHAVU|nr:hypothetical protein PHAVU_003G186900g [Phaseolus vulgaris]XP_007155267.1 hypothetical protein PHAVU_003G186900g [Phaseolus vulgaris]XP_007155268.1 hypothetical protein PHAVU_003G186900g [Phaseolus vulgaris]ESW27260.1 hypothetical protein PHAVU_003G186900g [Phaseolus vulgaris]ESW27261.1 hypothetical protein PHAVU_003G186900g [Phaseolus vulgaris]ESW27262.1 hypothetical protein PHAVU_003G186900g [Phaseolus vulgaris]
MAEESTLNQLKSEKVEPEDVKENSNGRLTITNVPPKILSRYLSGPKSSCHDLCKYGIPHAVEAKPRRLTQKRVTKKEMKTKVPEENVTSLAKTKKSGSGSRPSQTPKIEKANSPVDIKEVVTYEKTVTSDKNSPPFEETHVSLEHNNSDLKQEQAEPSLPVQECSKSETEREMVKNKSPSSSSRKETENRSKQTRKPSTGGKEKSNSPSIPLSSKRIVKKSRNTNSKGPKNMTREYSLKRPENVKVKPELASNENISEKILDVTEPDTANSSEDPTVACDASKLSSPSSSSSGDRSLEHTNKKNGMSPASFASSRKGLRSVADKGKVNMQHKTRSVSRSPPSSSSSSSVFTSKSSPRKQNNAEFKSNKRGHDHQGENVKMGYKIRPKMSKKVGLTNKTGVASRKLTFRRGKVIELQPQINNVPRRLKFRPARILGDDMRRDINGARKSIIEDNKVGGGEVNAANTKSEKHRGKLKTVEGGKKRIIVGRKVGGDKSKIEGSKSGSENVVLKHQDVGWKKQNPGLYNNVIEETAIMLAELRKSKVKALVGAFETVISLDSPRDVTAAEESTS